MTSLHLNEMADTTRGDDPSELHLRKMRSDNQILTVGNFIADAVSHKRCGDGVYVPITCQSRSATWSQFDVDTFGVQVGVHMCSTPLGAVPTQLRSTESDQRIDVAVTVHPHGACVHAVDHPESSGQIF
jgi:hypothetical protein